MKQIKKENGRKREEPYQWSKEASSWWLKESESERKGKPTCGGRWQGQNQTMEDYGMECGGGGCLRVRVKCELWGM